MYDKPDSQYSHLVIASRKAETDSLGSSVSEVRAKSAVVRSDTDSLAKGASSETSHEVIMQQIAYLMSALANQTSPNLKKWWMYGIKIQWKW